MKRIVSLLMSLVMIVTVMCVNVTAAEEDIVYESVTITPSTTDSYQAYHDIQVQLNKMKELNTDKSSTSGLKLTITPGTYTINTGLKIYSNTDLILDDVILVRDKSMEGRTMVSVGQQGVNGDPAVGYDYYRNINIIGGTLDSNEVKGTIVKFHHTSNLTIDGTTFMNCAYYHDVGFAGCSDILIQNCTFKNHVKVFTENSKGYDNLEAIQLDILQKDHFPNLNPKCYDGLTCKDITIRYNNFDNVYRGIGCHSVYVGKYMTNVYILSNTFNNVLGYAVIASNFINTRINKNTIKNCGAGILYRAYQPNGSNTYADSSSPKPTLDTGSYICENTITITNKTDPSFTQWRYGIQVYGKKLTKNSGNIKAGDYRANKIRIKKNTINMKTKGMPIWLRGVTNSTVSGNIINSTAGFSSKDSIKNQGIYSEGCYKDTISQNTINGDNKIQNGIALNKSTSMKLTSNKIYKAKENGINLYDSSTATATTNTINNCGQCGIRVYKDSKITTSENQISNSGKHGIFLADSRKSSVIDGDTVSGFAQYGIDFQNSTGSIKNANVKSGKKYGIVLTQKSKVSISNTKVNSNKNNGIYVTQSSKGTIKDCTVQSNSGNGIYFTNKGYGSVTSTKLKKNKKYGIYKTSSGGKVTLSKVSYSGNSSGKKNFS